MKFLNPEQNICCDDVIQCIYNLNQLDLLVFNYLRTNGCSRTDTIAKKLKKERSTVYRSLQRLTCCGLCIKKTKTIKQGGYYHVYQCAKSNTTKKQINKCIDEWYRTMKNTIKKLELK
jgi:predicted transcriptional regulator